MCNPLKFTIMKNIRPILTVSFVLAFLCATAAVWRVNNRPNVDADFSTWNTAYNAASNGDIIYLEGSPTSYGSITVNKQLTIIGAGYWLDQNSPTQSYKESSKLDQVTFSSGSNGSVIEGLEISNTNYNGGSAIAIYNNQTVTIRRNHISVTTTNSAVGYIGAAIYVNTITNSTLIEQNWIEAHAAYAGNAVGIRISDYFVSSTIRNNVIYTDADDKAILIGTENEAASLVLSNNVFMGDLITSYASHYNNILIYGTYTPGPDDLNSNNLCSGTQYPAGNSNQQNVDMTTVFEDYTTYIDNGYLLKAGSAAIAAGVGGDDCGVFGTGDPYVLSGMPPIPAIIDVEMTQSIGTTTLPVTVEAKSNN